MDFGPRDDEGRPCKACFSFEDMLRMMGKKKAADRRNGEAQNKTAGDEPSTSSSSSADGRRTDCPLDKDELGRSTWNLMHSMSVYYPKEPTEQQKTVMGQTIDGISKTYPCDHCAADFRADLRAHPPLLNSRDAFARWMCEAHNRVNVKLGKERFDCSRVMERWRDGWRDGSCENN
ncbi:hypothetical protein niasHS_002172 [Heterodera schachtii]|uniref:Sulfhydryl oxidase n=1 Tax=Heterodera schachtii TaxID=97005 RepID=A0ABD2KMH0_HETSC